MKKIFCPLVFLFTLSAHAQMKEGHVVYERTVQLPLRNLDPELAAKFPKSRTDQFELLFGNNQSLWQYLPNINADENSFSGNGIAVRMGGGPNEITYCNFNKGSRVDQREVLDTRFIVSDSIVKLSWKLSDETRMVLQHTVHKATAQRTTTRSRLTMENGEMKRQEFPDTVKVVAWYTTDIPVPAGPDFQGQLPGLILEMDVDNGQTVYKAIEIAPKVNTAKIKEPKDGKKVTAVE